MSTFIDINENMVIRSTKGHHYVCIYNFLLFIKYIL